MKDNKEFIDGIYQKYDEYLKEKERKNMKKLDEKDVKETKKTEIKETKSKVKSNNEKIAKETRNRWQ